MYITFYYLLFPVYLVYFTPMIKTEFSSCLAIRNSSYSFQNLISKIQTELIPLNYEFFEIIDHTGNWIYIYSNFFEIISYNTIKGIKEFLIESDSEGLFLNIYDSENYCVLAKFFSKIQFIGINLWSYENNNDENKISLFNSIIAPFKQYNENIIALSNIAGSIHIDLRNLFSGFDKNKNNIQKKKGIFNPTDSSKIKIISQVGLYNFSTQQLSNLGELRNEYSDVYFYKGSDIKNIKTNSNIFEIYFIINRKSYLEFIYENKLTKAKDFSIYRIVNFKSQNFELKSVSNDVIAIITPKKFKNYIRYNTQDFESTKINVSGITQIYDNTFVYDHSERICPWTGKKSEWNIDSISSLSKPYPVIAVSRKEFFNENNSTVDFKLLREEEIPHFHPSFVEIYQCLHGTLQLEIRNHDKTELVSIEEGNIGIIMPKVPHHIKSIKFLNNKYEHTCIQLFSKFHYPFYTTKRNFDFY